jgi:hypothetical protein
MDSHLGWQHRRLGDWQALSVQTCPLVFRACAGGRHSLNGSPELDPNFQNVHFGPKTYCVDPKRGEFVFKLRVRQVRMNPPPRTQRSWGF